MQQSRNWTGQIAFALLGMCVLKGLMAQESPPAAEPSTTPAPSTLEKSPQTPPPADKKIIPMTHVPEHVKQQIRDEVRAGLREDTISALLSQAKQEQWGVPGAWPEWIERIKLKGDLRVRTQGDLFASDNVPNSYFDFQTVNEKGGIGEAGLDAFTNTTEDRYRLRLRARLSVEAKMSNEVSAALRFSSGNTQDPVSTNQTLGNDQRKSSIVLDQAYLRYVTFNPHGATPLELYAGKMPNPWLSTDLVWDGDLAFDGIAGTYRWNLRRADTLLDMTENDRTLFLTLGAFPLQEIQLSSEDKWLYGAQLGTQVITQQSQSTFTLGLAYYGYDNIVGVLNELDSTLADYTAPQYVQKGNTPFDIRNDADPNTNNLIALASDYDLVNLTFMYDWAGLAPHHVVLTGDYVKNIGFDAGEVRRRTRKNDEEKSEGYQVQIAYGWPDSAIRGKFPGHWRVAFAFRYLERDAVLDAFTDSDFHLGGTDAEGYALTAEYGLIEGTWLSVRYLSANEVDGPPLGIDTIQFDVNAKL